MTLKEWEEAVKDGRTLNVTVPWEVTVATLLADWRRVLEEIEDRLYFSWQLENDQNRVRAIIQRELEGSSLP